MLEPVRYGPNREFEDHVDPEELQAAAEYYVEIYRDAQLTMRARELENAGEVKTN
jgi:hypothetical protein